MEVIATQIGFYGERRYREGDKFTLSKPEHFSKTWMAKAGSKEAAAVVEPPPPPPVKGPKGRKKKVI